MNTIRPLVSLRSPTAYSYIRFSSAIQAQGDSLRRQTKLAQEYCQKHSLTLSEQSFTDLGVSAFNSANTNEDNGLGQFLKALEQGVIPSGSFLLVESLDRLSRAKVQTALRQLLNIIEYGITVVTLIDNRTYSSESETTDLIISLAVMERAHNESKTKSERIKAAWANKRANPTTTNRTSLAPFWLKLNKDKRTYTVIEKNAETVRRIFQMSINGHGIIGIARKLNEEKIPSPKGGSWSNTSICRILNSKAVIGEYTPNIGRTSTNTPISDYYPSIIDESTFYLSQSRKAERSKPKSAGRKTTFPNVFNQVAKCGVCGATMYYDNKSPTLKYLTCREFKKKNCTNRPIRIEFMHKFIIEQYLLPKNFQHHINMTTETSKQGDSISSIEEKIKEEEQALNQLMKIAKNLTSHIAIQHMENRDRKIMQLKEELEETKAQQAEVTLTPRIGFKQAQQLVANALQMEVNDKKPNCTDPELIREYRVTLNRSLKDVFNFLRIHNLKSASEITVECNQLTYAIDRKSLKLIHENLYWKSKV
ncbi:MULTISPECIES: recombinase family protein [Vibrio]|uniref:recombinase family protein n=1 Tax=Vibrio TaxID=662 RepID=UPI001962530E|nr:MULTISPECIES: recombinase family protein [unclassified Vibrio]EGU0168387.1 recombinase family protein [Vibrio parahaemolyticus]ELB2830230.1 recombinase family protein [Vibrio alginolyticus]QRZ23746.1 recombinase family protein [Vibrio sp. sp1]